MKKNVLVLMLLLSAVACGENTKADDFDTKLYDNMSIEEKYGFDICFR